MVPSQISIQFPSFLPCNVMIHAYFYILRQNFLIFGRYSDSVHLEYEQINRSLNVSSFLKGQVWEGEVVYFMSLELLFLKYVEGRYVFTVKFVLSHFNRTEMGSYFRETHLSSVYDFWQQSRRKVQGCPLGSLGCVSLKMGKQVVSDHLAKNRQGRRKLPEEQWASRCVSHSCRGL